MLFPFLPAQRQRITAGRCIAGALAIFGLLSFAITGAQGDEETVVQPCKPRPGPLDNPMKGWCPFTDAGRITQPYSMVFSFRRLERVGRRKGRMRSKNGNAGRGASNRHAESMWSFASTPICPLAARDFQSGSVIGMCV